MEFAEQKLGDILAALSVLRVDWRDETARRVIGRIERIRKKTAYTERDAYRLLDEDFDDGLLICRLFMGLSKDAFQAEFGAIVGPGKAGMKGFRKDPEAYIAGLTQLGLLEAMAIEANRQPTWTDVLVERLRSGRGSAISGQKRGRELEDFAEAILHNVFGDQFDRRCAFAGARGRPAKCDFAIPSKDAPRILIEAKGYHATGSKMSDIIGDIDAITSAKRQDTALLLITDGLTWRQRQSDLKKLVDRQNHGEITRIYTTKMADRLEADLRTLKREYGI